MIEQMGGRKFVFGITLTVMAFALTVLKVISANEFFNATAVIFASYVAGNVVEKFSK